MQQSGASEIFLDGKLIHQFGTISTDVSKIRAYDPLFKPVSFILPDRQTHVLAIRYVLQPSIQYTTIFESRNPAIQIRVFYLKDAVDLFQYHTSSLVGFLLYISGSCFLLAILHFAFFLYYPSQKGNLAFAVYAIGFLLFNVIQFKWYMHTNIVSQKIWIGNLAMDLRLAFNIFLLAALYNLLGRQRDRPFWILVGLSILCLFLNVWPYDIGWKLGGASMEIITGARITRIAYLAVREKKRGARIIFSGAILFFIFFTVFFSLMFLVSKEEFLMNLPLPRIILYVLSFLCIPVATSIFLGLDFAFANRTLNQKLQEVEELSAKSIRQEKEKQDILAAQNETLEKLVTERTTALSKSLQDLKNTQVQLIQSEKMASLGELTAGIAHEIQNPLNFVNNFSEVNSELISEMKLEIDQENLSEARSLADMIYNNEQKICFHGKRADAIVKGMLEHSRKSNGQKEPASINGIVDEYMRLAYHGLRAKDKSFNASLKTDLDPNLGLVSVVPQDIGRVILNLLNNAFHAVSQKQRQSGIDCIDFEPVVSVSTRLVKAGDLQEAAEIVISDNGIGIPEKIVDKIFQPFFTTKPAGEGTGLGLSLSYDIITKIHGGTLVVESVEGHGSRFIIQLPIA
nr:ATP-binding protein [Flavihumibacter fluvii]